MSEYKLYKSMTLEQIDERIGKIYEKIAVLVEEQYQTSKELKALTDKVDFIGNWITETEGKRELDQTRYQPLNAQTTGFAWEELDKLPWRQGKYGEWLFGITREGSPSDDPTIRKLHDSLSREGSRTIFDYIYKISGDNKNFIGRVKKK